ncbi:MAG: bifunctional phosphoribosylaminoimidazolecarboxamide formyltransferase/IMP cyclohydrolase [Clostridia bacterium]|nr:bifunctional phosphoribosylaminoimidazolecarboxamide formyltransferase/IMP cyclohydrolase [Clostridia bacterium]
MEGTKKVKTALISVFDKSGIDGLLGDLQSYGVTIYSTGGTWQYLRSLGIEAIAVEDFTTFPSILGGRVKTLHPLVFGGILARRDEAGDREEMRQYNIPEIDMVVVDLYPFEQTLATTDEEQAIIEKIDIGGISLIRAAAKNFADVLVVASAELYEKTREILAQNNGATTRADRQHFAAHAFGVSSHYDTAIFGYFNREAYIHTFRQSINAHQALRYGENPHQTGFFFGELSANFDQLHGKEISYNNLNDLDAAIELIHDFEEPTVAILKHNNACGLASRPQIVDAWKAALAGDPVSAFGGVIITNTPVDEETAQEMNKLFFEIILAPAYSDEALATLKQKKNRIILINRKTARQALRFKSALNGVLAQQPDTKTETADDLKFATTRTANEQEIADLLFANKIVKHTKSNAIVLAKDGQLLGSGTGQTSRVDALRQAIAKALAFGFDLNGAVMASDAFFPFADSVQIAREVGISAVVQPGGSIRDSETIAYCDKHNMAMALTGFRHFKH